MLTISLLLGLLFSLVIVLILDRSKTSEVLVVAEFELPCLPAVAFEFLNDFSVWQACIESPYMPETRTRWSRRPVKTVSSTIGNLLSLSLSGAQEHPFVSLEIVQAWKDRRLQLITQDLAAGRIRDDRLDFQQAGAFCRVQWRTKILGESGDPLSRSELRKFRRQHKKATCRMIESVGHANKWAVDSGCDSANVSSD